MKTIRYKFLRGFFAFLLLFTLSQHDAFAQPIKTAPRMVTGTVTDSTGAPLPGCNITNAATHAHVISGNDGSFRMMAEAGNVLNISHILYRPGKYTVPDSLVLAQIVLLAHASMEEEVLVNTGYQAIHKARSTGAYGKVETALLQQQAGPDILSRLKNVSNVYFDTKNLSSRSTEITIRGISTINGKMAPLIVLDNFPYAGSVADINAEDVESITILKDATAASIWGAKSANGVIVITTKKGSYNKRVSVDVASTLSYSRPPAFTRPDDMLVKDYIAVEAYLFARNYKLSDTAALSRPPFTPVYEMLLKRTRGQVSAIDSAAFMQGLGQVNPQQQYLHAFYQPALTQQHHVSLTGGSHNHHWLVAGGYLHRKDHLKLNEQERKNIRLENRFRPVTGMEIALNLLYTHTMGNSRPTPAYNSITIGGKAVPYLIFADAQQQALPVHSYYRGGYTDTAGAGKMQNWNYYPLTDYTLHKTTQSVTNLLMGLQFSYRFLKKFNLIVNFRQEQEQADTREFHDKKSFYVRDLVNLYTGRGATPTYPIPYGDVLLLDNGKRLARFARAQLHFLENRGSFDYQLLAGAELNDTKLFDGSGTAFYGYTEDPLSYANINFNTQYPTYITGSTRAVPGAPSLTSVVTNRFVSGFANAELGYKKRYIANASLRSDASNIFGLSTNDKWNPFWSAGLAWNITREAFFKSKSISLLKLRTTLGIGGNVDPSRSALAVGGSSTNSTSNFYYATIRQLNNPSLRWEKSKQLNIAADFELLHQRLNGSVDYYLKKSTDLYGPFLLDYTAWGKTNTVTKNVAAMQGRGLEISLQSRNILHPFLWNTHLLLNYNESRTTAYYQASAATIYSYILSSGNITPLVGKPAYAIAAYKWGGLDAQGNPMGFIKGELSKDYNKIRESANNGDSTSVVFAGQTDPKFFGAFINNFQYKGWSLAVNISFKAGHYFKKQALSYSALYTGGAGHADFEKRWQQAGDELTTQVPAMVYTDHDSFSGRDEFYTNASIHVLKADHIRMEYINLGYDFSFAGRKPVFKKLSLIANLTNLGILWRHNKENLDPDNYYAFTPPRQFSLSLRAGF